MFPHVSPSPLAFPRAAIAVVSCETPVPQGFLF